MAAAKVGAPAGSVDDAVRSAYESWGYGPGYKLPGTSHRTGHGIGMEGHEPINLVHGETTPLAPGMCFSNEPGIYLPGKFGIRLEDCFYMTASGPEMVHRAAAVDRQSVRLTTMPTVPDWSATTGDAWAERWQDLDRALAALPRTWFPRCWTWRRPAHFERSMWAVAPQRRPSLSRRSDRTRRSLRATFPRRSRVSRRREPGDLNQSKSYLAMQKRSRPVKGRSSLLLPPRCDVLSESRSSLQLASRCGDARWITCLLVLP